MSTTLTTYRRTLAPLLGVYEQGTAAASSTTGALICTTGLASGARFTSSVLPASLFTHKWLFRPAAVAAGDRDRLIATYEPLLGQATVDDAWTNEPDGEVFEITSLFGGADLNALVNESLKRCWLVVDLTFAVLSTLTRTHSLAVAAPWLTDPRWVYQVGQLKTGLDPLVYDPYASRRHGKVIKSGPTVSLDGLSFNTTDTVYVKAIAPASAYCAAAATPTVFTQTGLGAEADVAIPDPLWVAWGAVLAGKDRLDHLESLGQATAEAQRSRAVAAARFGLKTRENFQEPERTFTPLTWMGPTYAGSWSTGRR